MSRGYRGAIIAAFGITLLWTFGTGAYMGALYSSNHENERAVAYQQGGNAHYQGPAKSLPDIAGLPGPVERFIANPRPQQGQDTEQRDLAAQEAMALWAFWMVGIAVGTFFVTSFGTVLIWRQVRLTREAVEDTGRATQAMDRANQIAEQAQRPWLEIDIDMDSAFTFISRRERGFMLACWVVLKNIGATPAVSANVQHALAPAIRNPVHEFRLIAENWTDFEGEPRDDLVVLPGGTAAAQLFMDFSPEDPRHPFSEGAIPTFLIVANYVLPGGQLAQSAAWFSISPADGNLTMIFWDDDRADEKLELARNGYVRVT